MEIKPLKENELLLINLNEVYIFQQSEYLYHITNLTEIIKPFETTVNSGYKPTSEEEITTILKTNNMIEQLKEHKITKRSIDFLGKIIKYVYGNPDHDDLIAITSTLNKLIEMNNKQIIINKAVTVCLSSRQLVSQFCSLSFLIYSIYIYPLFQKSIVLFAFLRHRKKI